MKTTSIAKYILILFFGVISFGCSNTGPVSGPAADATRTAERKYLLERVDDAAIVQVYADGFTSMPLREKTLMWRLSQAAIAGRDIFYDQRYVHNLEMRDVLEAILTNSNGVEPATLAEIQRYAKLFWINTGPYNNLTARKFVLKTTPDAFAAAAQKAVANGAQFPVRSGESLDQLLSRLRPAFFDPNFDPMVTNKTPGAGKDILEASANNLYVGVTMKDLEKFTEQYPLNSRLVKQPDGRLIEEVYRIDGRYGPQIAEIVRRLEAAAPFATEPMSKALQALMKVYRTGEDSDRRAYDIAWVQDKASPVDTINYFTEVYLDARGMKGAWEALVFYVNRNKTEAIRKLAENAQWFEDRMPWDAKYRKQGVQGITANAIDVVIEMGDSGPVTPIGINLPNDQSVREQYGSKSVSLSNINEAYEKSQPPEFRSEFSWTPEEAARSEKWGGLSGELHTNMHEVIGHASGKVAERLQGNPQNALKEQFSALEEGRADLVGLYFIADPKLAELGLFSAADQSEIMQAEYESYTRNAIVQLRRVREGSQIEEDHMRNRQMIVKWLMANTRAIEERKRDGKTFYVMIDAKAFRDGVGKLLAEVQRIKGEGDYPAAKKLFETYGIHFDTKLRDEVVARVDKLNLPSYTGFVMPKLKPILGANGQITDVEISYPQDFAAQMLEYSSMTKATRKMPR
ncbi:MAG: peptidase M49 [Acidobacteria bacterium]|nr:peptidase M49 [Acidobacteriota bacterium]